jgi:hypothetical protein
VSNTRVADYLDAATQGSRPSPPVMDEAAQRAQAVSRFLPTLAKEIVEQTITLPAARAAAASGALGSRILGYGASLLGATDFGADQLRRAEVADRRFLELMGVRPGVPMPTMPAPDPAPAPAPEAKVPNTGVLRSAGTPQQQQEQAMIRAAQALEGLNVRQIAQLMGAVPPAPVRLTPQQQVVEDLRQLALQDYLENTGPNATVEQASAARRRLLELLGPIAGNNQTMLLSQ